MKELNDILKKPFSKEKGEKLEQKIHGFLKKELTPEEIFKKIKNSSDIEGLSRFLYNFGLEKTLLKLSAFRLKHNKSVAWAFLLKVLIKYNISPKKKLERLLFHHWLKNKENHSVSLFACEQWGDLSPEFRQLSLVYLQDLEENNLSQEKELLEQLAFVQAQDLILEEEEIISKLLVINPENDEYKRLSKGLQEKKAHLTIQKQKKTVKKADLEDYPFTARLSKNDLKQDWLTEIFKEAKQNKKQTKNLSLFLYFCDFPEQSINLLETHVTQLTDYWFYLDWCLEAKQYTKGLELINQLLLKTNNEISVSLPLFYMKAQILYFLGQRSSAVEYLQVISQFKPDYKSTEYLLNKWSQNI
ncbi:MAG: hypothetical protein OXN83_01250 [Oligoflexia bacterium]|nr:hypothetical protein [Oligoflexia bacterium]